MRILKSAVVSLSILICSSPSFAGSGTITVLDSVGATKTYSVITDGSGNFISRMGLCDQSAAANCATVDSNHALNVSQPTAANLNATVVGTGTFAVQVSGVSTAANQATANSSLASIDTKVGSSVPAGTATIGDVGQLPYPIGATPYTATATGTTGATTATLAGASSVTTYLCGFSIRANATAAATGNATVTGVITATLNFTQWTAPNASGLGITEMIFAPCIPASGTNQSVAVVSAAPGTGGVVSVTAWGYKL